MTNIDIFINGEVSTIRKNITILDLINDLDLDLTKIAVEKNLEIIEAKSFSSQELKSGDKIEIVHFIGGG